MRILKALVLAGALALLAGCVVDPGYGYYPGGVAVGVYPGYGYHGGGYYGPHYGYGGRGYRR